jgi:sugar (pentulose or hexulose) kinase
MIVGIDIGTQSLKAVVTDDRLRPRGQATAAYRPCYPRPGWAACEDAYRAYRELFSSLRPMFGQR